MDQNYDFSDFFPHNIFLFRILGYWRPDNDMKYKFLYQTYTTICTIAWITFLLSQMAYMYQNCNDVAEVTAASFIMITFTIDLVNMAAIYYNMNSIKMLIKSLNQPLLQVKCKKHLFIADSTKKLIKSLFYTCIYFGVQTYIFWSAIPFLGKEKVNLAKGWLPYDWRVSPNYEITYVFQNLVTLWNDLLCLNLDTTAAGLLTQVGLQCDMLCCTLDNLTQFHVVNGVLIENKLGEATFFRQRPDKFSRIMTDNLIVCIKHYNVILFVAREIERIHRYSAFVIFIGGGLLICSGLFQLSMVDLVGFESFMLISFLICMITQQFVYCYFGNEVTYKSALIFNSAYNTPWLECDNVFRKTLLQFMTQTIKPIIIRSGHFKINLSVFTAVIKSSYSYFTLLNQLVAK